jgi:uncharacterized protein YbaA (DUF1428 family)
MSYVDGYVLPVAKNKVKAYKKMAYEAGKIWMKYGALQYLECVGDDLRPHVGGGMKTVKFQTLAKAKSNETVFFSFIVYKSRKHRDMVNAKVMKDMEKAMNDPKYKNMVMPFDPRRIAFGGFKALVEL